jgi:RNA polymerase sigma factor (sigma-70 family)
VDPRLVTLAQQGDEGAFSEIAHALSGRLYAIASRILRDHDGADDATQQAIVRIWRDLPSLRDPARFEAWAYRILVNSCYAEARRELESWLRGGHIRYKEDILDGIEQAPGSIAGLYRGENLGKRLIRIVPEGR